MRRNSFEQTMRVLHFEDNKKLSQDQFYKVRPLFQHLNEVCKQKKKVTEHCSIDEIMIPYYGKHGYKQFICGKAIRFGFKVWDACWSDGSLLHAEPFSSIPTNIVDRNLGQGPNVVMKMVKQLELQASATSSL
ncbi:unnamed protein product [Lepeophtheirus salmonis]|uniref:(salmon louse) hypothetical protein n=1 Tax=Lepeophtheirus salmonis TaxID=72036 RepID=A0A7R8CHT5_LEPSM|nr:unnamed protein product [Lepeophtheirus salmonis]CAF2826422.1 unnamed protein product [Lepeophtheirus salmonis]